SYAPVSFASAPVAASQPSPFPTISQVTSAIKAPLMVLPTQPQTHLQAKPLTQIQLQLPPQIQNQLHIQPQPPPPPQLQPPAASIRICCSGCSKVLQKGQTAFQRKGSNQLFCSTVCLTGFTLPPAISIAPKKTCHLCLKVIGNPKDLITVPVDSMNTLKEFCSQACLTIYKSRVEGLNEDNIIRCSMRIAVYLPNIFNIYFLLLCSPKYSYCASCGGEIGFACFIYVNCIYCILMLIADVIFNAGASFPCTNCQKLAIPQYHLAMPDGSIRNFCTYDCVGKFQERLQKPSPQVNGSSTVTANASGVAPRGPQHPSAAPRPSAPPQITNPTSNQTTIPPHVPAPGLAAPQGSQQHQQQPGAAAASSPGPARLTCKQCQKPISSKPEVLQYKNHVGLFCSRLCCDSYKREKDVKATCEYCKEEKILKDITMYEHKLRPFCCEGCKLLFKHELSKQHGAQCRVCAYCSNMTHNTIQNHFGGKLEEFCTEECMSLYTVLFYEMAKCYGCKTQGTLSESLKWDGTIKHFCNLHCVLQFCCKSIIPDQPISNGTLKSASCMFFIIIVNLNSSFLTGALPTSNASSKVIGDASTQTDAAVNAGPHQRRMLKNKALMCKPIIEEQAIQCNLDPPKSLFETGEDFYLLILCLYIDFSIKFVLGKRKREDEEEEEEQEYMEMPANTEHPLRCPVQLYLFYLSRCSDSVKQRSGMFYLQPEASCDPSSPVWFSEEPLERTVLDSMLTRILAVRDVYHQDPRRQLYNSSDEESS
uniref:Si:ch211-255f4.7 n=1 Tax=Astyanax mexicanus TaxID=7994 RepID=A0A8B9J916_ASTMX